MTKESEFRNLIETLISIYTIEKGVVKVLLLRKKTAPYKGYWMLPGQIISTHESAEDNVENVMYEKLGFAPMRLEQFGTYTKVDRLIDERVIAIGYIGLIDSKSVEIKKEERLGYETEWFNIASIPKMAYDHDEIMKDSIDYLRKKIVNSNVLKSLFPSDFTLPEIQSVYEKILNKTLDRRNFRKKFINLGLIEDTGYKTESYAGRPAKLYTFKDEIEVRELF